jgi:aspartate aminotransferase
MKTSKRVQQIQPSATLALVARTAELRAEGRDIISFGAGEPDFATPGHIRAAAARAMDEGKTRYTAVGGVTELRKAIVAEYASRRGLEYGPNDVVVTCGAKQALFNALLALLDPGDRVVVPAPYWVSYPEMVKAAGGTPVIVECRQENGFRLQPEDLRRVGKGARVLLFNGISNPTGAVHSPADIAAIAEVCAELDLAVVSDEIYENLVYDGAESCSFAAASEDAKSRTIVVSGVSKTYAMTGWRIGWAAGPSNVIGGMRKLQGQSTSNATSISQWAALEALTGPQEEIRAMIVEFQKRRDRMVELLSAIEGIEVETPGGAFYVMPRVDAFFGRSDGVDDSMTLAGGLLDQAGIAVVPGLPFGAPNHVRLSYACSMDDIENGIERMASYLTSL